MRCQATALLIFLLAAAVLATRCVDGSRGIVDDVASSRRPAMGSGGGGRFFGGYELPRAKLVPPSGPSERHNSLGPEFKVSEQQQQLAVKKP